MTRRDPKSEAALLSAPDTKAGKLQRACLDLLREHERDGDIPTCLAIECLRWSWTA